ncbi:endoplasmic reticulum junction formation protein lunapark-A-like [Ptychodera flava]|uniref:endoplasmic reticulum junction formation protein lunapark-A-like n=1 Tax=Ptychodera flava TaxID=63121 RepID=UPI00396A73C8
MGAIIARFRKKPSTMERLEGLEKDIQALLKFKRRNQQLEKHYIGMLLLYSILLYIIAAVVTYFYYFPDNWKGRVVCSLPLLLFPFIIWGVKKLLHWYFVKRTTQNDLALEELRDKKKKILDDVMEHETYKTAKEILEKFDPTFKKPESPPPRSMVPPGAPPPVGIRQRPPSGRGMLGPPGSPARRLNGQQMAAQRPMATPRPILPRERGAMDKFVEYLVGDGPNSRYALICKYCYSHNGMALAEEFEYLAFKCAYCNMMNPSRKTKPNAPPLAVALPSATPPPSPRRQLPAQSTPVGRQQRQQNITKDEFKKEPDKEKTLPMEKPPDKAAQAESQISDDENISEDEEVAMETEEVEDIPGADGQISEDEPVEGLTGSPSEPVYVVGNEKSAVEKKTD